MRAPHPEGRPLKLHRHKLAHVLLALTLVVAQFLAQAHGYTHLRNSDQRGLPAQPCSECLACSPLLAGSDAPVQAIAFIHPAVEAFPIVADAPVVESFRYRPFQSRAPPALS
jgi:hypothetical protein